MDQHRVQSRPDNTSAVSHWLPTDSRDDDHENRSAPEVRLEELMSTDWQWYMTTGQQQVDANDEDRYKDWRRLTPMQNIATAVKHKYQTTDIATTINTKLQ